MEGVADHPFEKPYQKFRKLTSFVRCFKPVPEIIIPAELLLVLAHVLLDHKTTILVLFIWVWDWEVQVTAERLRRRRLPHHPQCLLCNQQPEMMQHLTLGCSFSRQVWHEVLAGLRMTAMTCTPSSEEASLYDWWSMARQQTPKQLHRVLVSVMLLTPWMICVGVLVCVKVVSYESLEYSSGV
jgi:hypothetical protein